MAIWIVKAMVQRGLGMLPAANFWNELLQTHVARSVVASSKAVWEKLDYCRRHLEAFRGHGSGKAEFTAFDLGTGWLPGIPVGMYLSGAKEVYTCDVAPLLKSHRVRYVLEQVVEFADHGELAKLLPSFRPERVERIRDVLRDSSFRTPEDLLRPLNIRVLVKDARDVELPNASVDLFTSTQVLEYIPAQIMADVFERFRRAATPEAVMSHYIDLSDQYAAFDRSIAPYNFLRFSPRQWWWINNQFTPLTRLRLPEYRRVITESNWRIANEHNTIGKVDDLERVPLADEFKQFSQEELLVLRSWIVANC